ncbi:MAG TPA: transcriptional repressor LexA [Solirubrobacterales bacterium]|nr:transcriptional repressor LexA [Solirubrobacterales bacterium]HMU28154.1 transcriptional repressor LexA [Solirubrobacterales bacterium]HMW44469.1 transcriptional repressor LexA [Solirubrobacterales bacterium]HMX72223.1 transcriptional repressor LexA [Solirubrobacterales bacterium]HMY25633.1 transcriptional repressor LexA [Solirubrobacterales bacterium]
MVDLTKRQREIFDYIGKYTDKMGYPPTVREIGQAVGLTSSSTVHVHLANLEKAGVLRRDPSKPRALEVLVGKAKSAGGSVRDSARDVVDSVATAASNVAAAPSGLPLLGRVSAGPGILAEENIEDYVDVPGMIGGSDGDYVLEVRGESMKNAGIMDGDYVIVHPSPEARDGEIVVALLGDEDATVKRFYKETDHFRLEPENETMSSIITTDAQVMGKVIGVFRKV